MILRFRKLRLGERFEPEPRKPGFDLLLGGPHAIAATIVDTCSVWLPLRGDLAVHGSEGNLSLSPGHMLVSSGQELRANAGRRSLWLALIGASRAWIRALHAAVPNHVPACDPLLYPRAARCPRTVRRLLFQLLKMAHQRQANANATDGWLLDAILLALWESQRDVEALVERCPGRSYARRRQNLLRLLRVRNRIIMRPNERAELSELAEAANYSPWHFVRAFREVFGEPPCEYASRIRLEHARRLIQCGDRLTVTEIAGMIGYDSRSAFSRSFRHAFGMTASQARPSRTSA